MTKEEKRAYDRERYLTTLKPLRFGDRKCDACDIPLKSKYGAHYSRKYCRQCIDNGSAKRHQNREFYKKNRTILIKKSTAYQQENREYKRLYYRNYAARKRHSEKYVV